MIEKAIVILCYATVFNYDFHFQETFTLSGTSIPVIAVSLIPWSGRLIFKRYISNKAHKYGIQLFKVCSSKGYTWSMKFYSGKSADEIRETWLAHTMYVCLQFADIFLDQERILYIDNLFISHLNRKARVVGTLKNKKNKFMPKWNFHRKLKKPKKWEYCIQRRHPPYRYRIVIPNPRYRS